MKEFSFEIDEHSPTSSTAENGCTTELHRVKFIGADAKWDIRSWSRDHTKMGKGITLTTDEFKIILDAFRK